MNKSYGLTPAKEREARRILSADPVLDALLRGHRSQVAQIGPWTPARGKPLIGVVAQIDTATPIAASAILPYVCNGDPTLGRGRIRAKMRDVTQLHVLVHFALARVVDITPIEPVGGPIPKVVATPVPGSTACPPSRD
jgi:hypothetical protein